MNLLFLKSLSWKMLFAYEYFMEQIKVLYESILELAPKLIATIAQAKASSYMTKLLQQ